jgi:hypothetical protein
MLNQIYEKLEQVLDTLDAGGEQSKAFAGEIAILKDVLGYAKPAKDIFEECSRRDCLTQKLRRIANECRGINASLPTLPLEKWFDGTIQDATIDVFFEEYDLAKLLQYIADVGVSESV